MGPNLYGWRPLETGKVVGKLRRATSSARRRSSTLGDLCFVSTFSRHDIRTALIKKKLSGLPSPSRFDRLAELKLTQFIGVHRIVHLKGRSQHELPGVKKTNVEPVGREDIHVSLNVRNVFLTGPMRGVAWTSQTLCPRQKLHPLLRSSG